MESYYRLREHCPACRSDKFDTLYSCKYLDSPMREYLESYYNYQGGIEFQYLQDMEYILVECQNCGLLYQRQILGDFLTQKLYDEWIDPKKAHEFYLEKQNIGYFSDYALEILRVMDLFNGRPDQLKFLDFGMGWGYWCRMAMAFGVNVFGADLSETRVAQGSNFGVNLIAWDEIPGTDFDFINTEQVMEHLTEPLETLCHLKKGLKPGGIIKVSVPECRAVKRLLQNENCWFIAPGQRRNNLKPVTPLEHINGFTYASLEKMAQKAGFEIMQTPLHIKYKYIVSSRPLREPVILRQIVKNFITPWNEHRKKGTYLFLRAKPIQ